MRKQDLTSRFDAANVERDTANSVAPSSMADFDKATYSPLLDGIDIDDGQKSEFLRILWDMMRCFVEWNVPSESWGQIVDAFTEKTAASLADVE